MPGLSTQLHEEQQAVDRAYARLDALRSQTRTRLDTVRAAGSHGSPTQRTERDSFATMYEDRLTQLRAMEDRLVFGRLDDVKGERRYIGRIGLSSENHEPILTDWRAEAARPFYEATPSNHGDIVMRRHITLNFRDVIGIEDEVLDVHSEQVDKASKAGTLTGEGALLASLSSRRTGKMTDIVATIQAEQDRIIRSDLNRALVVQGGPAPASRGRAAPRRIPAVHAPAHAGTFRRAGCWPQLGVPALHRSGATLLGRDRRGLTHHQRSDSRHHRHGGRLPYAAKLKGDRRMTSVVANAIAARVRVPAALPTVTISGIQVPMLATDIEQAQADAKRTRQPHNKARETFIRSMLTSMQNRYAEQLDYTPDQAELNRAMSLLRMNEQVRKTLNLCWLPIDRPMAHRSAVRPSRTSEVSGWLADRQRHRGTCPPQRLPVDPLRYSAARRSNGYAGPRSQGGGPPVRRRRTSCRRRAVCQKHSGRVPVWVEASSPVRCCSTR